MTRLADGGRRRAGDDGDAGRGLIALIRVLLLFESSLYAAVTPVLPHYAHTLHASKPAIGVLAAAYAAGLIPGAPLGGWLAARIGVRRTTVVGLVAFGLAVAAFGFVSPIAALDALRAVQGLFCGLIWCGGLTWAIRVTPEVRRSRTLGTLIAAATFGTLVGPVLGTLAVTLGTAPAFSLIGATALVLAWVTARQPDPVATGAGVFTGPRGWRAQLAGARSSAGLALGAWLVALEALTFGAENALLPLRLSSFGASALAIGATFVIGSGLSAALAPVVGRVTDRYGSYLPIAVGMAVGAPLLLVLFAVHSPLALAALMVITFGGPLTLSLTPAVSLMTASAERTGVALVLATTMFNLAYAVGETIGAPAAAGIAQVTSDLVPFALISAMMLATLAPVLAGLRAQRRLGRLGLAAGVRRVPR